MCLQCVPGCEARAPVIAPRDLHWHLQPRHRDDTKSGSNVQPHTGQHVQCRQHSNAMHQAAYLPFHCPHHCHCHCHCQRLHDAWLDPVPMVHPLPPTQRCPPSGSGCKSLSERCWGSSRPQLEVDPCSTTGQHLHPLHRSRLASGYHRCGLGMAHRVHVHVLAPALGAAPTEAAVFGARAVIAGRLAVWLVLPRSQQQGSLAAPGVAARTTQQAIGGTNMEGSHEVKCSRVMIWRRN
jgi:hypothetical protein